MQASTKRTNTEAATSAHCSDPVPACAHYKLPRWLWKERFLDFVPLRRPRTLWRIWCLSLRSLRGHIEMQLSTERLAVDLGPAWDKLPDGSYRENTRTAVRSRCVEVLLARHPWVDSVDLQMFLMGLDAGAELSALSAQTRSDGTCIPGRP